MTSISVTTDEVAIPVVDDELADIPTPLISLKNRQKKLRSNLFLDIVVPRWDDEENDTDGYNLKIVGRYKPLDAAQFQASLDKRQKQSDQRPDWMLLANADALVNSCIGIYAVINGEIDKKFSLRPGDQDGKWTRFDADLARMLEMPIPESQTAVAVCKNLYQTDGDLSDAAARLVEWSARENEKIQEDFTKP